MANRILVVDDEKLIVKGIKFSLEQDGMEVDSAFDGEEALNLIKQNEYDLIVLDVMLPKMDGLEVCQQTRGFSQVPIIMVTAKCEDMDKIMGLEYGADDYITKPFNILELKARIKAILRRSMKKNQEPIIPSNVKLIRGLELHFDSRRVFMVFMGVTGVISRLPVIHQADKLCGTIAVSYTHLQDQCAPCVLCRKACRAYF